MIRKLLFILVPVALLAAAGWSGFEFYTGHNDPAAPSVPITTVKRGDVNFLVTALGELQGAQSEMVIAPPTGGRDMVITYLREAGETVQEGDVVVRLDTTEQEFQLREAEADLQEVEQQFVQAQSDNEASDEEARFALINARAQVQLAELDVRQNQLVAPITAQQNNMALEAARDQLHKLEQDVGNRQATSKARLAIQEAARAKARVKAETARRNIDAMTVKARSTGYVALQSNRGGVSIAYLGMQLPQVQLGDTVYAGSPIAQILGMDDWIVSAKVSELDRASIGEGNPVTIKVIALPGKTFHGKVVNIGGTSGPVYNRTAQVRIQLDETSPEMRPGMSTEVVITTGEMKDVLWTPSQAVFQEEGRSFVYLFNGVSFLRSDVNMVKRRESHVVLTGLNDGQQVALANPTKRDEKKGAKGVMQAVPK